MAASAGTQLRLTNRLGLTPGLTHSLAILALPTTELVQQINSEAAENPLLKVTPPRRSSLLGDLSEDLAVQTTLGESLRRQLSEGNASGKILNIALYLVGDLSGEGYLVSTIDEITNELRCTPREAEAAIQQLQACEPSGIGARSLTECLKIQLTDLGVSSESIRIVLDNLDLFAKEDWAKLKSREGISEARAIRLAAKIRSVSPYPADAFAPLAEEILPDICIESEPNGEVDVHLCRDVLPELDLEHELIQRAMKDDKAKHYIQDYRRRADALIRAVNFRGKTLLQIMMMLAEIQHPFIMGQADQIAPMTRVKIAEKLGVHPSTVVRAVAGKFVEINGSVYPVSTFFQKALLKDGEVVSSAYSVQQAIRRMIAAENRETPLSDLEIVDQLCKEGVDIARRTVAKYRGCLKIPSSYDRKRKYLSSRL